MKKQIVSRKGTKTSLGLPEKEINVDGSTTLTINPERSRRVEKTKRQKLFSDGLFSRLALKHYPYIFQDERLTTRLFI